MRYFRIVIYLFAFIGLLFAALGIFGPYFVDCQSQRLAEIVSPDNRIARLNIEKCKNQVKPMLQVEISDRTNPKKSHLLTFASASSTEVTITWSSSKLLVINYPSSLILTQEPPELDDIKLLFLKKNEL